MVALMEAKAVVFGVFGRVLERAWNKVLKHVFLLTASTRLGALTAVSRSDSMFG